MQIPILTQEGAQRLAAGALDLKYLYGIALCPVCSCPFEAACVVRTPRYCEDCGFVLKRDGTNMRELKLCLTCAELFKEAYHMRKMQNESHSRGQCDHCGKRRYVNRYEVRKIERG